MKKKILHSSSKLKGAKSKVHPIKLGGYLKSDKHVRKKKSNMALGLELNTERFVGLMTKLIGEVKYLQDNPPKFVPEEDRLAIS